MDKYNLYDNIIGATYTNLAIDAVNNKGIYFNFFNKDSYINKTFLKVAFSVANFENQKIYINCKYFDFLKILFNNYTIKEVIFRKSRLRFRRKTHFPFTNISLLAAFEAKEFQTDIGIFEEIWKEYYEKH